jgi:hypothetical protein
VETISPQVFPIYELIRLALFGASKERRFQVSGKLTLSIIRLRGPYETHEPRLCLFLVFACRFLVRLSMFDHRHAQRAWGLGLTTYLVDERGQVCVIVSFENKKGKIFSKKSSLFEYG